MEGIGLNQNTAIRMSHADHNHKLNHHNKIKSLIQDRTGTKRQFGDEYLLPQTFDSTLVKGKMPLDQRYTYKTFYPPYFEG